MTDYGLYEVWVNYKVDTDELGKSVYESYPFWIVAEKRGRSRKNLTQSPQRTQGEVRGE